MKIGVAADHGGYELKEHAKVWLTSLGHEVKDFGAFALDSGDDYPDFVEPLGRAIVAGEVERGIAICGSGVGASIAVNKIDGVKAALVHDVFSAHQGVEDDNMNLLCMGGRVIGVKTAEELMTAFLNARFTEEARHKRRLEKVRRIETKH